MLLYALCSLLQLSAPCGFSCIGSLHSCTILTHAPVSLTGPGPHPAEEQQQQQPSRPPRASGGAGSLRPAKAVQRFSLASLGSVLRQRVGHAQPRRASEASAGARGTAEGDSRPGQPSQPRVRCAPQRFQWLWVAVCPQPPVLRPACLLLDGVCNMYTLLFAVIRPRDCTVAAGRWAVPAAAWLVLILRHNWQQQCSGVLGSCSSGNQLAPALRSM